MSTHRTGWGKRTKERYSVKSRLGFWVVTFFHDIRGEELVPFDRLTFAPKWMYATYDEAYVAAEWVIKACDLGGVNALYYDWGHANKGSHKAYPHTFHVLLIVQQGRCAYCDEIRGRLDVDHNHATKEIRWLLCRKCNLSFPIGRTYEHSERIKQTVSKMKSQIQSQNKIGRLESRPK